MNTLELNGEMARKNFSSDQGAAAIGKSRVTFNKKRYGEIPFDVTEILALSNELSLSLEKVNTIFFDGKLHISKSIASFDATIVPHSKPESHTP